MIFGIIILVSFSVNARLYSTRFLGVGPETNIGTQLSSRAEREGESERGKRRGEAHKGDEDEGGHSDKLPSGPKEQA